jgi:hypothetical protein
MTVSANVLNVIQLMYDGTDGQRRATDAYMASARMRLHWAISWFARVVKNNFLVPKEAIRMMKDHIALRQLILCSGKSGNIGLSPVSDTQIYET